MRSCLLLVHIRCAVFYMQYLHGFIEVSSYFYSICFSLQYFVHANYPLKEIYIVTVTIFLIDKSDLQILNQRTV